MKLKQMTLALLLPTISEGRKTAREVSLHLS